MENQTHLVLPNQHLNYIVALLEERPHKEVGQILGNIYQQIQQQQQKAQEEAREQFKFQVLKEQENSRVPEDPGSRVSEIKKK